MGASRKAQSNAEFLRTLKPLFSEYRDGVTGTLDSDGNLVANASEGLTPGWTWVQLDGQREGAAVLNSVVNPSSPGIPVQTAINARTGKRQVVDIDWEESVRLFGLDTARRMATPQPQLFESDALLMGKVEPSTGLNIYVRRFVHDDTEFPGGYYDLTTIIGGMTASTQEMVLVSVNPATHVLTVTEGAEKSLAYPFGQVDVDAITLPAGDIPLAGLVIQASQTASSDSFVPYVRWFDRREFLGNASGFVTLTPASSTRNTIQPSGDYPALILKNNASQTVAPFQTLSSAGAVQMLIDKDGLVVLPLGAVGTPSLTFTGDLDTGIFETAGNKMAMAAGGKQIGLFELTSGGDQRLTIGDGTDNTRLIFNGAAATTRDLILQTAGSGRWIVRVNATAEGGSNAGSDFQLLARSDAGSSLFDNVLTAQRSTGFVGVSVAAASIVAQFHVGGAVRFDGDITLSGQAARTIALARMTTSNTAGNNLVVQAGGATSGATNKAGGDLVLQTGTNTGNVAPSHVRLMAGVMNPTSGTGDNSNVDRLRIGPTKVLTNNSAITIVNATLASNTMIGGIISYSIQVFDGTNVQTETGQAVYSGINKAGAFTCSITEVNSQQDVSSGTLATTWAITGANPAAISVNANSSLTPSTGYPRITYNIQNFAQQVIAIA